MEKRGAPRIEADQVLRLTTLDQQPQEMMGKMVNISIAGMRLFVDRPLALGLPLKLEWDESLLLGEVCYCQPVEGGYALGLQLEHVLLHTRELACLSRRLLGASDAVQDAPIGERPNR